MMFTLPRTAARIANTLVAAAIAFLATQLLMIGFEAKPLASDETIDSLVNWIERRPLAGAGIIGGLGLLGIGLMVLIGAFGSRRQTPVITIRRPNGRTLIDRSSLADSIDRHLTDGDTIADVSVTVRRSGRIDIEIDTFDAAIDGPATKIHNRLDELVELRHLPCRTGRVVIKPRHQRGTNRRILR